MTMINIINSTFHYNIMVYVCVIIIDNSAKQMRCDKYKSTGKGFFSGFHRISIFGITGMRFQHSIT